MRSCQLPEAEGPVGPLAGPGLGLADRHPLEVGLHRRRSAYEPVALFLRDLVVLGAVRVGVVRDLVVVPDAHEGVEPMDLLEIGIRLVLRVPGPVVREGGDLLVRLRHPPEPRPVAVVAVRVLVEVVPEVEDGVKVVPLGDPPVHVEVPEGQVGAGDEGQPDMLGIPRQGLRPAHRGTLPERFEAVVVGHARLQAGSGRLEGVVAPGSRCPFTFRNHLLHSGIPRHLPADRHPVGRRPRNAGPEQHPVGERIAARHPVGEDPFLPEDGEGPREGQDESRPRGGSEEKPAVHGHGAASVRSARNPRLNGGCPVEEKLGMLPPRRGCPRLGPS